jgi:hypothetical protein
MVGIAAACPAGVVLTEEDGSTVLMSAGMFKQVMAGEPHAVIVDAATGIITYIHTAKRVYAQGTPEELCGTVRAFLDQSLATMTPEQRAMVRQLLDDRGGRPPKVTVRKVGDGGKVAGLPTTLWEVKADGRKYEEIWITADKLILSELDEPGEALEMVQRLGTCLASATGGAFANRPDNTEAYRALFAEGLTLKARYYRDGEVDESQTKSVEVKELPASEFLPPEDFKKVEFTQLLR